MVKIYLQQVNIRNVCVFTVLQCKMGDIGASTLLKGELINGKDRSTIDELINQQSASLMQMPLSECTNEQCCNRTDKKGRSQKNWKAGLNLNK